MGLPPIPAACFDCVHFDGAGGEPQDLHEGEPTIICTAFPRGIPDAIVEGRNMHREPVDGDNGLQYEKA